MTQTATRFNRLILALLLTGIAVGLAVVTLSDYRTRAAYDATYAGDKSAVIGTLTAAASRQRHAEFIVDWQKIAGDGDVLETSLLWRNRPFKLTPDSPRFPITRFTIAGDTVAVDGQVLRFHQSPIKDAAFLDGTTMCLFSHLYAAGATPDRASVIPDDQQVPPDLRANPNRVTPYELQLWDGIDRLRSEAANAKLRGVDITELPADTRTVHRGKLYEVWIGADDLEIVERDAPAIVADILRQAQEQDAGTKSGVDQSAD